MLNKSEIEEKEYLKVILAKLHEASQKLDQKMSNYSQEIQEKKRYIWDNISQFDSVEKAANRLSVHQAVDSAEDAAIEQRRIFKLIDSPYFGRIDFVRNDETGENSFYIGIHSFTNEENFEILIYDWRAPISSLFYDFEVGKAFFIAPIGKIDGEILLKRQYRIKNSVMEYMIESSININDDVLQKELSSTSDEKMKNIVATIQKEQNVIIRNDSSNVLIIQGVAGSGKTSIALHRVAFLLYKYKKTLNSKNILIISPNKVFADYISNVLPELGEEEILEIGFDEIAEKEIGAQYKFQTFYQQVSELIDEVDEAIVRRIKFKATIEFVNELNSFLEYVNAEYFTPSDINIDTVNIAKEYLMRRYTAYNKIPVQQRLELLAADIIESNRTRDGKMLKTYVSMKIKSSIQNMFKCKDALSLYKDFYDHIGKPEMFQLKQSGTLEFADVFPFLYTKIFFDGAENYHYVKHLLVDEMQDYTPIQYAVLSKLFKCKMTILGDSSQSVNPYSSSSLEEINKVFTEADCVELCKSYRSTFEITNFAQKIQKDKKLIPIERHGETPTITQCTGKADEIDKIKCAIHDFLKSNYSSLGIICKTQTQADEIYEATKGPGNKICLLDGESKEFKNGIIITPAFIAKGLEFDQVIIPFVCKETYKTDLDKSMLYIACTRAMHKLDLTYSGTITSLLQNNNSPK
nr:UvrD-helicase domain-containing protein [uncultured Caproiciproducens sp.]